MLDLACRLGLVKKPTKVKAPESRLRKLRAEQLEDRRLLSATHVTPMAVGAVPSLSRVVLVASPQVDALNQPVKLTATVTSGSTAAVVKSGSVDFYDGKTLLGNGAVNSQGIATITTTSLVVGNQYLTAFFSGTSQYSTSTSHAIEETVSSSLATTTKITVSGGFIYGNSTSIVASVTSLPNTAPVTGNVVFKSGTATLGTVALDATGHATLSGIKLAVGGHKLSASYVAHDGFTASTSGFAYRTMGRAATMISAKPSAATVAYGTNLVLTAEVVTPVVGAGDPSGQVLFYDGGVFIGSAIVNSHGVATLTTKKLPRGKHVILAQYAPGADYLASLSTTGVDIT